MTRVFVVACVVFAALTGSQPRYAVTPLPLRDSHIVRLIPPVMFTHDSQLAISARPVVSADPVSRWLVRPPITSPSPLSPVSGSVAARSSVTERSGKATVTEPNAIQAAIRQCESGGSYTAQNRTSTASGAYQFLDSTWQHLTGLPGHARDYPPPVQDAAFLAMFRLAGTRPWASSASCWGHA